MRNAMDMEPKEIQIALKRAGVTQSDIARQLTLSYSAISRVVFSLSTSHRVRVAIADAIKKDVKWIWPSTYIALGGPRGPGRPKSGQRAA